MAAIKNLSHGLRNLSKNNNMRSTLIRPDGAKIHYEIHGKEDGIPVLVIPGGGMRSSVARMRRHIWNPLTQLSHEKYFFIAMDQRMSSLDHELPDDHNIGWETFREDQIALLDHVGISEEKQCHILGSCIGPSYALQLLRDHPHRFGKAVLMQPIGLNIHTTEPEEWEGTNAGCEKKHWFGDWANEMKRAGKASQLALDKLHENMFGPSRYDFVFSITRDDLRTKIMHPLLVLCGNDIFHPAETAREIYQLAVPRATLIEEWRFVGPEKL